MDLDNNDETGLILIRENGTEFTRQTGGVCCNQRSASGIFLEMEILENLKYLYTYSNSDEVNEYLKELGFTLNMDICWPEEAWVGVNTPFGVGILTWPNSD